MTQESSPPSYADIRLITGSQRNGKSNSLVAFPLEDYIDHLTAIMSPSGNKIKAKTINANDKSILKQCGLRPNKLDYVRVFSNDDKQSKLIKIPRDYMVLSPVHIFANFHLYGVRFSYIGITDIIENINTQLFDDSWILADESVLTDARNSMESMGKLVAMFSATIGKRNAKLCVAAQYHEMVERRIRLFATTTVTCSYDKDTKFITCDIKSPNEPEFSVDYYAPLYWRFFNTKELIQIPQEKIDRALARIYKTEAMAR